MAAQPHIFVSYSRRNFDIMRQVAERLRAANLPVWTDERLTAGTPSWKDSIERAIQGAQCVIVLMSPSSKGSEWVERELDYAYVLQRPIFPVLIDGTQRDAVPFELINMQYVDLRTDFDQGVQQLIRAIEAQIPTTMDSVPPGNVVLPELPVKPAPNFSIELKKLRRMAYWYFFEPRKFRLLEATIANAAPRLFHAMVTAFAFAWILLMPVILSISRYFSIFSMIGGIVLLYGFVVFVALTVPYRTRRSFFTSILSALVLFALVVIIVYIALWLMVMISKVFGEI